MAFNGKVIKSMYGCMNRASRQAHQQLNDSASVRFTGVTCLYNKTWYQSRENDLILQRKG